MTDDAVVRMVNEVFRDSFEIAPERLLAESEIFRDLGLDSLDMVDLVVALQKKFNVQLHSNPEVRQIRTLADLYAFIRGEQAKRQA
jgi:acyl carrier protein